MEYLTLSICRPFISPIDLSADRKARHKVTLAAKEWGLQARSFLSKASHPAIPGKAEEKETDNVDITGLIPLCHKGAM